MFYFHKWGITKYTHYEHYELLLWNTVYEVWKVHEHSTVHHYRLSYLLLMRWNEEIIWCEVEILIYQNNKTPLRYILFKQNLYQTDTDTYTDHAKDIVLLQNINYWYQFLIVSAKIGLILTDNNTNTDHTNT